MLNFVRALIVFAIWTNATTNMHNAVIKKVMRANILFFDKNPIGRIVTRFSKDLAVLDFMLPFMIIWCTQGFFRAIFVSITVSIINPWLFIGLVIALILMILLLRRGVRPMQEQMKLDGISRGPIHSTFAMIISGLVTIRTFGKFNYF